MRKEKNWGLSALRDLDFSRVHFYGYILIVTKLPENLLRFVTGLIHRPEFLFEFCCKTDRWCRHRMSIFIALQFQNFFFGKTLPSHIVPPEAPALQFYHRLYKFCNVDSSNLFVCTLTCPLFGVLDFSLSTLRVLDFCRVHFQGYILHFISLLWTITGLLWTIAVNVHNREGFKEKR